MGVLRVAACLWDANGTSHSFSRCYDEVWALKLFNGFRRNLTIEHRAVLFTDRERDLPHWIEQEQLLRDPPDYGCMIEPFRLGVPMILVGLDTVIVGNIDHMARYCLEGATIALPRDPYQPARSINGVALVPGGFEHVAGDWDGENDMEWLRRFDTAFIDDLWPGEVLSLKFHKVRDLGLQGARIVYMHGRPKANELGHLGWIREHWR
jgi:hypothetical protein